MKINLKIYSMFHKKEGNLSFTQQLIQRRSQNMRLRSESPVFGNSKEIKDALGPRTNASIRNILLRK